MTIPQSRIRNFCIIAHIDHGKSTLADRLLLVTGAITPREFRHQLLDDMDLERERGITIKASAVRLQYRARDGQDYLLNLIDTPGHVDFTHEVSKSLRACEGALLVVDAAQGVEAQTVANLYLAMEHELTIIPVINKVDLPNADTARVQKQLAETLNVTAPPVLASAKDGTGIDELLERIVRDVPPPAGDPAQPLQALIFDSRFDVYKGVILYCRVIHGALTPGMPVLLMSAKRRHEVQEVGVLTPQPMTVTALATGEVGYVVCNIKEAREVHAGDTVTSARTPAAAPLAGYKPVHPLVFCGLYPVNAKDFPSLREALEKLRLSDASFSFEPETSSSFGFGFRCGFLGLLHLEIIQERLEREFGLSLVVTTPNVVYRVRLRRGGTAEIDNPTKLPSAGELDAIEEPTIRAFLIAPSDALGPVMALAQERRGVYKSTQYLGTDRAMLIYEFPLAEVIVDFHDRLKSVTRGYGSMDYEFLGYTPAALVKLDILLNGDPCDALSSIVPKEKAYLRGRDLVTKLKELIPRQLFEVAVQAAIGSHVIARETVRPMGKNMTAKCSGGDITRKRKLWEKQREGKKRMKQFGKVEIPQEAFMAVLKLSS